MSSDRQLRKKIKKS